MTRPSLRTVSRMTGAIALAMILSGCGLLAGPSEGKVVAGMIDQATTTHNSLNATINYAVTSRSTMSTDFRALAGRLESDLAAFNELAGDLRSTDEIVDGAEGFAQAVNLAAGLLDDGAIEVASEVSRTQVVPKYTSLQSLLTARQEEIGGPDSGATWWAWLFGIPLAVLVVFVIVQRRRPTLEDLLAQSNAVPQPEIRSEPGARADRRRRPVPFDQRPPREEQVAPSRPIPPPIGEVDSPARRPEDSRTSASPKTLRDATPPRPKLQAGPVRNPEAIHSVRGGLRTVELRGIIDAALATMVDAGWEVAIECPDVSVLVDPLRMRRLLSNLLLSATAHGAEHIGLVAVIVGDRVEANVGHDGSLLDGVPDTTDGPPEVEHQLTVARQLLAGMHADARWTNWRGVSLYTMELVRGPDEVAGHDRPLAATAD